MANTVITNSVEHFSQISLALMPMEDIQTYLQLRYGFIANETPAFDVQNVGGIPSDNIAISIEGDRYTVNNSLQLGGRDAEEYLTTDDARKITEAFDSIKATYTKEDVDLRDEIYQLRAELAQKGYVQNVDVYKGMFETFNRKDVLYSEESLFELASIEDSGKELHATSDVSDLIHPGDWIVIKNVIEEETGGHLTKVTEVNEDIVIIDNAYTFATPVDQLEITKTMGTYYNQRFGFLSKKDFMPSSNVNHTMVDDDQYVKKLELTKNNTGVAYTFKFGMQAFSGDTDKYRGYLSDLKIRGSIREEENIYDKARMTAYVMLEEDLKKFKNPIQAREDGIIQAESKPLIIKERKNENVFPFDFSNGEAYPILVSHDPSTLMPVRYALIVILDNENGAELTTSDTAAVIFNTLYKKAEDGSEQDLQTANNLYRFIERETESTQVAYYQDQGFASKELYYVFGTREMMESDITPFARGLYTVKKDLPETMDVSYARVTMRMQREGAFEVLPDSLKTNVAPGDTIRIQRDQATDATYDMTMIGGMGLSAYASKVVIGKRIVEAAAASPTEVLITSPSEVRANDDIYRIGGYRIRLVAIRKELDEVEGGYKIVDRMERMLEPVTVVEDRNKKDHSVTDRVLFEAEFEEEDGTPFKFNAYEMQIIWQSPYSLSYLTDDKLKHELYGGFAHLNLTLDATI